MCKRPHLPEVECKPTTNWIKSSKQPAREGAADAVFVFGLVGEQNKKDTNNMLTSSNPGNQYLRPEYLSPLPTTVSGINLYE